jgi:hypothetical protein
MPHIPAPPPTDHYTGVDRELVDLLAPYYLGDWPMKLNLIYGYWGPAIGGVRRPPIGVEIACMLKPLGEPQTSRETRAALFAAADAALNAIEDAGWTWTSTPQIDIRGDRFQNPDETWDDCWRGTLELTLNWKAAP